MLSLIKSIRNIGIQPNLTSLTYGIKIKVNNTKEHQPSLLAIDTSGSRCLLIMNMSTPKSTENGTSSFSTPLEDDWMIRKCSVYDEEYSDCTSIKARFNQYFIHGKSLDCSQWKRDSINCYKWIENKDIHAGKELIECEKARRKTRLLPHYQNNVWERRKYPPENWNAPLPEHLQKEYEYTYLNVKAKEMKGEIPPQFDVDLGICSIM